MWTRARSLATDGLVRPASAASAAAALACMAVLSPACTTDQGEAPRVGVVTSLALPKGLLDNVMTLTLSVYEGNVTCDPTVGQTAFPGANGVADAKEIANSNLGTTACANGVKFCGDLSIAKSDTPRVFSAQAIGADGTTLAIGCATATVNQDSLPVAIKMFRFLAPSVCGDSIIQPTEQCDPGGTATCDANCQTKELLLSVGSTLNGTSTGTVGDKSQPFVLWPAGTGNPGRFFAFYTDLAVDGGKADVSLRAMTADLEPIAAADSPALSAGSIYLPNGPQFPPPPAPFTQGAPAAAFLGGKYYVAFEDDNTPSSQPGIDVHLRSMDDALVADQAATPLTINGGPAGTNTGTGEANIQGKPAIAAGPQGRLFIAWEDASSNGIINGRTLTPPATLGNQQAISTGTTNSGVSLAATATGWVAVWLSGSTVKLRVLDANGTPQGSEQVVNAQGSVTERPRVASLADGRFAITWNAGGDIFMQRYDASGAQLAGDQATAINDVVVDGLQTTPSITGTTAAGGSYVVVWLDVTSNNVNGRMLGGSTGFLFNNVNGQSSEFQVSSSPGRVRANPVVGSGGAVPYVGVAWEDKTAPGAGIVARRFPLPSE